LAALGINMIGISGYARSGKDTLGESLCRILKEHGIYAKTFAFANCLKQDINDFCFEKFNISSFTKNDDEKKLIRPLLVGYGESARKKNKNLWIERLQENLPSNVLPIVTDIRYENEADWLNSKKGFIINLDRTTKDGILLEPANDQEKINAPLVKKKSFFNLSWSTVDNSEDIDKITFNLIESIFEHQIKEWKATFPL
jgi:hypothetical protein